MKIRLRHAELERAVRAYLKNELPIDYDWDGMEIDFEMIESIGDGRTNTTPIVAGDLCECVVDIERGTRGEDE